MVQIITTLLFLFGAATALAENSVSEIKRHPVYKALYCRDSEHFPIEKTVSEATFDEILAYYTSETLTRQSRGNDVTLPDQYLKTECSGFFLYFNPQVFKHPPAASEIYTLLCEKLSEVSDSMTTRQLSILRRVPFWIEWNQEWNGSMYHPGAENVEERKRHPAKSQSIEVTNVRNFMAALGGLEPMTVVHELAHAYYDLVFAEHEPQLIAAYDSAVSEGLYDSVDWAYGGFETGYAATNEMEYFAELTESYFGRNEYYPFTREELREFDPKGYLVLQKIWAPSRK